MNNLILVVYSNISYIAQTHLHMLQVKRTTEKNEGHNWNYLK